MHGARALRRATGVVVLLIALAACGGGNGGRSGSGNAPVKEGAREVAVDARNYEFDPSELDLAAGEDVAIALHSVDQRHDFAVDGKGVVVDVAGGKTASGGLRFAKPGTYTFYCSIPGHRAAGMEGTITVS
jgi:plastocyanin